MESERRVPDESDVNSISKSIDRETYLIKSHSILSFLREKEKEEKEKEEKEKEEKDREEILYQKMKEQTIQLMPL